MKSLINQLKRWFGYGEEGFTLIELLIVIAVLGALASVVVPNVSSMLGSANIAAANTEIANVKTAANSYLADYSVFPSTSTLLYGTANTSDVDYLSALPKATYTFDPINGRVTAVTGLVGGWTGVVFDLNGQKWIRKGDAATPSAGSDQDQ